MLQEIKTLVQTLNEQRDAYYNKDSPKMTDKEYDRLFDRLEELEKKSGIIFSNSPTQSVGYYPVSELAKVRHTRALLSLEKTKQIRELADFMENQDTLLMLKLDGLTVKLVYEEGRLVQASTRGDGNVGEDITHNIPAFENVPLSISYRERLVTTGEAFIYKDDFRQLKDTIRDGNGEPYKNARNLASGSVRNLNPEVCKGRHVHFIPFNVLEGMDEGTGVDSREFKLMQLGVLGFDTCPYVYMGYRELAVKIKNGYSSLKREPVFKCLDIIWNQKLKTAEISVVNDAEFKVIIIGSTQNLTTSRGYMYLFYTNDSKVLFPSVKEIIRRLKIVASGERLTDQDAEYFDWEEYGSLEMQRIYFSEIIKREAKTT